MIVTAGGKNVAPAVLEDRIRSHALISQAMVVGDGRPFVAALITLDDEAFGPWKERNGKPADATVASLRDDPDLVAAVQVAIDDANKAVSRAESIRKFRILDVDFTQEGRPAQRQARDPPERAAQGLRDRHRRSVLVNPVLGDPVLASPCFASPVFVSPLFC